MEEEVSFLRRKVNRLEDMIYNINDKLGLILEKFLNHRASQVAGMCQALKMEEDICESLVSQLKGCIINSNSRSSESAEQQSTTTENVTRSKTQCEGTTKSTPGRPGVPKIVLTDIARAKAKPAPTLSRTTRSSAAAAAPHLKKMQEDLLAEVTEEVEDSSQAVILDEDMLDINVKAETLDYDYEEIQDDDEGHDNNTIASDYQATSSEEEEDHSESDKDDPEFNPIAPSTSSTIIHTQKNPKKTYTLINSYQSVDEFKAVVKAEEKWLRRSRQYTKSGTKLTYLCKADHKCPVNMYALVNEETGAVDQYICTDPGQHMHRQKIDRRLPIEVKQIVDDIYFGGTTAAAGVQHELAKRGFAQKVVPMHKLANYITTLRKKRYGDLGFMNPRKKQKSQGHSGQHNPKKKQKKRKSYNLEDRYVTQEPVPVPLDPLERPQGSLLPK